MKLDPYATLGLGRSASTPQIKKAFRKLAARHHPDHNPGDAEAAALFQHVQSAGDILLDPRAKLEYDLGRSLGERTPPRLPRFGEHQGNDISLTIDVLVLDIILANERYFSFKRMDRCPECDGKGVDRFERCLECKGFGFKTRITPHGECWSEKKEPCPSCDRFGFIKVRPCAACAGSGLRQVQAHKLLNMSVFREGLVQTFSSEGDRGPFQGLAGNLIINAKLTWPTPGDLSEAAIKELEVTVYELRTKNTA